MHKIDGPTATPDGLFTNGDAVAGVQATIVTADWLNAVELEISNVVEGAEIVLDKANNGQLLAAIRSMIVDAIPPVQPPQWFTGDYVLTMRNAPADGWIVCDDGTIGSPVSAATTRANDDCEALYELLWTFVGDAYAPVSGGRGASAESDWLAGKTIGLTKILGRSLAVAGGGISLTARQIGEVTGNESHLMTEAELPAHTHVMVLADPGHRHSAVIADPGHAHSSNALIVNNSSSTGGGGFPMPANAGVATINAAGTGVYVHDGAGNVNITSANVSGSYVHNGAGTANVTSVSGSGSAHNIMQPTSFVYAHIKL